MKEFIRTITCVLIIAFYAVGVSFSAQTIKAEKVGYPPVIDGIGNDEVWQQAQSIVTYDNVADIDLTLKALYTDNQIFFLVVFPDADESRTHKSWVWDKIKEMYILGRDREDVFVLKWNMESEHRDLSIYGKDPYAADVWFWKACRTDPKGYADDKIQTLDSIETRNSLGLTSKAGTTMYLLRTGDSGKPVYKTDLQEADYADDKLLRYSFSLPTGSRADIQAKGVWKDGAWTVEFARALNTRQEDDLLFDVTRKYQFGVSRYEIAGRQPNPKSEQPLYGSGDVGEELILTFEGAGE
ncbi:MAG: hypothetical protein KAJ18_02900 [Candidatus Omnitrophica bacterium]|nr:hypothetical protein [Candidatus Omnitrophota bacterium]